MRLAVGVVALIALGACEKPPAPTAPAAAVTPAPAPAPAENPGSAPDTRIGALAMTCGGEAFRVAFERGRAVIVGPDGSNMELKLLEPQPGAPQNVRTYTNGVMTFSREETADGASVVRFARGRMAFQECVVARS